MAVAIMNLVKVADQRADALVRFIDRRR